MSRRGACMAQMTRCAERHDALESPDVGRCDGLRWEGSQEALYSMTMSVQYTSQVPS